MKCISYKYSYITHSWWWQWLSWESRLSDDQRVGSLNPSANRPYVRVSSGKTLNPKLLSVGLAVLAIHGSSHPLASECVAE